MHVGADYYPEHWPRERWAVDLDLMKEADFTIVRMAEFDWASIEPEEGRFNFSLWDEAIGMCAERGIQVLMCTPTASMPAWVARKYPDALAVGIDGRRKTWGIRRDNCFSEPTFRELSRRVTRAMAEHYRDNPTVIGWQPDNELGHPICYCSLCRTSFQNWLRETYGTTARLNEAWGTHFWGHQVREWSEIVIPDNPRRHNPSALLDWQRHYTWQVARFLRDQVEILRETSSRWFVTHNFMEFGFQETDYFELAKEIDFVSWDNYPNKHGPEIRYRTSMTADLMRGFKARNFWITEQTAGATGVFTIRRNTRPGEIRSIAYQQLAHGADAQIWFRWRTCTAGREQYWHGILGHDGKPQRRYHEAALVGREYRRLTDLLEGTTVRTPVAFVFDYDSDFATRILNGYEGNEYVTSVRRYYDAFFRTGVNVDFIHKGADLSGYRLVVAPNLHVLPDAVATALVRYVEQGGVLMTDCRSAVRDETSLCHARTLPGLLSPALGIEIEEYEGLQSETYPVIFDDGESYTAVNYVDWVLTRGAQALARFDVSYLTECAAVTRHEHGAGVGYYVGAIVDEPAFYDRVASMLLTEAKVEPAVVPPPGVEVSVRSADDRSILFIMNHRYERVEVGVPRGLERLLADGVTGTSVTLEPLGVEALRLE